MEDTQLELEIRFEGLTPAEATIEAEDLLETLRDQVDHAGLGLRKDRADTLDLGATVVVMLGTTAIVQLARGLRAYLARRGNRVRIKTRDGTIELVGDAAEFADVAKVVAALGKNAR